MDYRALQSEILSGPKAVECAPYVVTNDMGKVADYAVKDQAIADILNAYLPPMIGSKEVGDGAIALALGPTAGPVFLYKLRRLADTVLPEGATDEQIAPVAVAQQVISSLAKTGFDVGNKEVRAGIDLFIGPLLTPEQAESIKSLAPVIHSSITAADVSRALRGPWE